MSYKYYFFDDQTVGAEDLNKLAKMFVSDGVADNFQNGVPYNISKLNEIISSNAGEGIVPESLSTLKVSYDLNAVKIQPGVAFFKDGTVIEIETEETLTVPENTEVYVYLESDPKKNIAYPFVSESLPEGNVVPLAKVSETGEITDLRRFARGKIPSFYSSDAGMLIQNTLEFEKNSEYIDTGKKVTLIDSGNSYRYLILFCVYEYAGVPENYAWQSVLVYDRQENMCYNFSRTYNPPPDEDYTSISIGTAFRLMECWYGSEHYQIFGNLSFDEGRTDLEITTKTNVTEFMFNSFIYPFKIKVVAF